MTSVANTYFRCEKAGDQFVGKTVSGLPLNSHQFSILPPFFKKLNDADSKTLDDCFGLQLL
jgi:hypothetical protein